MKLYPYAINLLGNISRISSITAFSTSDIYLIGRMVALDIFFKQRLFEYSFLGSF